MAVMERVDTEKRLTELVEIINSESELAVELLRKGLAHAVLVGDALNEARTLVPPREWTPWVGLNFPGSYAAAHRYMRISLYADSLPGTIKTQKQATEHLSSVGLFLARDNRDLRKEAQSLRANGVTFAKIAETMCVSETTAYRYVNERTSRYGEIEKQRQKRAGVAAIERLRREKESKKIGGGISEAYSLMRRLELVLSRVHNEARGEARNANASSIRLIHKLDDSISETVKLW